MLELERSGIKTWLTLTLSKFPSVIFEFLLWKVGGLITSVRLLNGFKQKMYVKHIVGA